MSSGEKAAVGRPTIFDEVTRAEICAYVAAGCTYRTAAQFVGCTVQAISALAKRDAAFAAQLERAVAQREMVLLSHMRQSSKRSWRAAVWLLEKTVGGRYGGAVETLEQEAARETMEALSTGRRVNDGGAVGARDPQSPGDATVMLPGEAYTIDEAMERLEQAWDERVDIEDASAS